MAQVSVVCATCGVEFIGGSSSRRYCSARCQPEDPGGRGCSVAGCEKPHRARGLCNGHYKRLPGRSGYRKVTVPCAWCGKDCVKDAGRPGRYRHMFCSLLCRDGMRAYESGKNSCPVERTGGRAARTALPVGYLKQRCVAVGVPIPLESQLRVFVQGVCAHCGESFCREMPAGSMYPTTCSKRCAIRLNNRAARRRRRARFRQIEHEPYRDEDIFESDGYRCQECGVKCRKNADRSKWHPRNPVVDHIVPTTWDGSSDTRENLQTLCFACNSAKGDRWAGQLRLIG